MGGKLDGAFYQFPAKQDPYGYGIYGKRIRPAFGPESEELSELFSRFEEDDRRQRRKALDEESVG